MLRKLSSLFIVFALVFSVSIGDLAFAKGFSGGGGGGGRSFSSGGGSFRANTTTASKPAYSNTGGQVNKAVPAAAAVATPNFFASKPQSQNVSKVAEWNSIGSKAPTKSFAGTSAFDKKAAADLKSKQATEAKKTFTAETSKFAKPAAPYNPHQWSYQPKLKSTDNYRTIYTTKHSYYDRYKWHPQPYVYHSSPSFGAIDALVFWMVLDNLTEPDLSKFAYNQANSPEFRQWKQEAEQLSKSNADLAKKLADMDKQLATMSGPKDSNFIPAGMPAAVLVAASVVEKLDKDKVQLQLATGGQGNNYARTGNLIKEEGKDTFDTIVRYTDGSVHNINLFEKGEVDAFIAQNDVLDDYVVTHKSFTDTKWLPLFVEPVQMIANSKGGVKKIQDLTKNNVIYVGPEGGGTATTWFKRFRTANPKYAKIPVEYKSNDEALELVAKNPKAVMVFISGLNSSLLTKAEDRAAKDNLRLVEINDNALSELTDVDGNPLFEEIEISSKVYPNLQHGVLWNKDITTVACKAVLVVNPKWIAKNGEGAVDDLTDAVKAAKDSMNKILSKTSEK